MNKQHMFKIRTSGSLFPLNPHSTKHYQPFMFSLEIPYVAIVSSEKFHVAQAVHSRAKRRQLRVDVQHLPWRLVEILPELQEALKDGVGLRDGVFHHVSPREKRWKEAVYKLKCKRMMI